MFSTSLWDLTFVSDEGGSVCPDDSCWPGWAGAIDFFQAIIKPRLAISVSISLDLVSFISKPGVPYLTQFSVECAMHNSQYIFLCYWSWVVKVGFVHMMLIFQKSHDLIIVSIKPAFVLPVSRLNACSVCVVNNPTKCSPCCFHILVIQHDGLQAFFKTGCKGLHNVAYLLLVDVRAFWWFNTLRTSLAGYVILVLWWWGGSLSSTLLHKWPPRHVHPACPSSRWWCGWWDASDCIEDAPCYLQKADNCFCNQ